MDFLVAGKCIVNEALSVLTTFVVQDGKHEKSRSTFVICQLLHLCLLVDLQDEVQKDHKQLCERLYDCESSSSDQYKHLIRLGGAQAAGKNATHASFLQTSGGRSRASCS
jgi:hypothetical protein